MTQDAGADWLRWMKESLELAARGRGSVAPNPLVGAVLVREGRRIGEGRHRYCGGPHAEAECLAAAADADCRNATLVVNLEPCVHHGKTPPCCELITHMGIRRVVAGMRDPNPLVSGKGFELLRAAGIEVVEGVLPEECRELNRNFVSHMERGRPWVTLKWAQSLDGRISLDCGRSERISSAESRSDVQRLRSLHPGILVGIGTVLSDDPRLTLRDLPGPGPHRFVIDPEADLPPGCRLATTAREVPLTVLCGESAPRERVERLTELGVGIERLDETEDGMAIADILAAALEQGVDGLLVEGGSRVHGRFVASRLVDEIVCITAPRVFGRGTPAVSGRLQPGEYRLREHRQVGADLWQVYRRAES